MESKITWSIKEFTETLRKRQLNKFDVNIGVSGKRGDGKCLREGSKVLMSNGEWKKIEDVNIGDEVISPQEDGSIIFSKVIGQHSRFEKEMYDIVETTRNKRKLYSCAWNHLLPVIVPTSKRTSKDDSTPRIRERKIKIWNAKKIFKSKWNIGSHICSFTTPAIEYKNINNSTIEPYSLGVFLGDGSFSSINNRRDVRISSPDLEIMEEVIKHYPITKRYEREDRCHSYNFSLDGELTKELTRLGLEGKNSGNKFIPKECLMSDIKYRKKLLAGLIDTDGFVSKNNQTTICTKSKQLSEDIKNLVFSLGGYSLIRKVYKNCQSFKEKRLYYDVAVQFKDPTKIPLKLTRKKERLRVRRHDPRNIAINAIPSKPARIFGIEIDSNSKWYITDNYMVTHNSTFLFKVFNSFKDSGFLQEKHQVYEQKDVIALLAQQQFSFCWDDEAINSGYKRDFQKAGQKTLVKVVTNYRDNFNVYASALPFFYSLDKDLRELIFVHVHIIERGLAVVLLPLMDQIHASDPWDTKANIKIEAKEYARMKNVSGSIFRYHKFTTFAGFIYFGPMTKKQEKYYKSIKQRKRHKSFGLDTVEERQDFKHRCYNLLMTNKLTKDGLIQACLLEDRKYTSMLTELNRMLKNNGETKTVKDFYRTTTINSIHNNLKGGISDIVPIIPS